MIAWNVCNTTFLTIGGLRSHVLQSKCKPAPLGLEVRLTKPRDSGTTVLDACGALSSTKHRQKEVLKAIDEVSYRPVCINHDRFGEVCMLFYRNAVDILCNQEDVILKSITKKKK